MVVGITGIFCSGKSLASGVFKERGYEVIDVDRLGYEALEANKERIVEAFGTGVASAGETAPAVIDRGKLGEIVFRKPAERRRLEEIVHPWMIRRVKELVRPGEKAVIDAALLVEMCLFPLCDFVLGVDVDEEVAVRRGMERNRLTRKQVLRRIRSQIPVKRKSHFVDKIIDNNGPVAEFREKLEAIIAELDHKV